MCRKVQIFISSLLFFFSISTAISQNIINWINVDPAVHIALTNFEAPLAIEVKIPKGETSVNLKVFFPEGINYSRIEVPQQEGTLVKVEKTTDSTINQPIFIVTTNSDSPVKLLVYRKFTNQIKTEVNYSDVVEAIVGGEVVEKRVSAFYKLKSPKLEIVTEPIEVGEKGENRRGFSVKNLGEGAIKEFYLSVQYPDNIKNKALSYRKNNGKEYLLVPENIVPKELANKGWYFYKVNADVLKKENNIQVSFSEIYEITNCFSVIPIQYQVYWGSDLTTEGLFEASKITEKIVSNYTVSNLLSYQEGKIRGETTDEVLYKGKIRINTIDKTIQTGEKSYFKVQLPVGITPVFSLGDLKSVVPLSQNVTEYTFLLPQGKKKEDSFDYTLKLQTNKKLTFVPSSKMVYYTTEESGRETCTATPLYTSIKKEITIPIEETLLHPIKLQTTNDTFSHTTTTQTIVLGNILTNDSYNTQSVTTASVTISTTTALTNVPYIATSTGEVLLPAHTPVGTYTLTYSLCAKTAPYNCSGVATVTIIVSPSPIKLQTTDDTFSHTTTTQTIVLGNILTNDSYNSQSVTTASVTINTTTALTNVPYIATQTGEVFLPAHTPAGTYTLTYRLCAKSTPYNCSEVATVTVIVNPSPIKLQTTDDTFSHTTTTQTIVLGNILTNDSYNTQSVTTASVTISTTTALTNVPYIATATGEVFLPAHTPAGTYTLTYSLCAKTAPYNCSRVATVTVIVSPSLVIARDDTYTITIGTTTITENIYSNDSIGEQTPNASLVNFQSIGGSKDSDNFYVLSVNLAGNVLIPQGTPTGTYTLQYRICDVKDSHNCATATITVMVTEIPTPLIIARDDTYTVTIGTTTITESIYSNDSIGEQIPNTSLVNFQSIGGSKDSDNFYVLSVNLAGNVLIPQGTPIGTYTLEYRICDIHHQSNCDTAIVKVSITSPPVPSSTLVVTPDKFTYTGNAIVGNILDNDTIDDNPIELPNDNVNIEAEEPTDTAPYIETSTGNVIVPTHTPAGTYTLNYELCIENLTICDATTVEVIVPDTPTPPAPPKPQEDETATPTNVLIPYNAISLNDDNKNDYFHIEGIEKYPDNIVRIYNKEGLKVFEVTGYDNKNQSFKGFTQGEVAVKKSLELPVGTYFYFIEYTNENHQLQRKTGWLYLKK